MTRLKQLEGDSWFQEGLSFKCTGCGRCCTGFSGTVWLTEEDLERILSYLKVSIEQFSKKYVRMVEGRISLKETSPHFDCIFYKDKRCTIYPVRPLQCRTYPFWPTIMESKESWEKEAVFCEGINSPEAEKISEEKILDLVQQKSRLDLGEK